MTRMYLDFVEAQNEIKRDLAELGVSVHPETMQDIYVADNPDFETKELANYIYVVLDPDYTKIEGVHEDWVIAEWSDRLTGGLNPGHAWKTRRDVWVPFLHSKDRSGQLSPTAGRFAYTYSDRMGGKHLQFIIDELKRHPTSRQLWLPVWDRLTDEKRRGEQRVPCSLGYWFVLRDKKLHLTYVMRSCDFHTHYPNDVALASIMLKFVADNTGHPVGTLTHFIGSLHVYAKDVSHVF